jgi:hypothetical protein
VDANNNAAIHHLRWGMVDALDEDERTDVDIDFGDHPRTET